jgi:hypothetical protein
MNEEAGLVIVSLVILQNSIKALKVSHFKGFLDLQSSGNLSAV